MQKQCAACGTQQNINGSLGGVLLCADHMADISAQIKSLHAQGKQVNVAGIARQMYREQYSTGNYILRDVPAELWAQAKQRALTDGVSVRELLLDALARYLK